MTDEWDWPDVTLSSADWDAIYSDPDDIPVCMICAEHIDDRRYCLALYVFRAWGPPGVDFCFAHVQCLRRVQHDTQKMR